LLNKCNQEIEEEKDDTDSTSLLVKVEFTEQQQNDIDLFYWLQSKSLIVIRAILQKEVSVF